MIILIPVAHWIFSISDHDASLWSSVARQRPNSRIKCVKRNLSFLRDPCQELNFLFYLSHTLSSTEILSLSDPDESLNAFITALTKTLNKYCPLQESKVRTEKHWINNKVKNAVAKRDKLYREFKKKSNKCPYEAKFTRQRNVTTSIIRAEKKRHYSNLLSEITWQRQKKFIPRHKTT